MQIAANNNCLVLTYTANAKHIVLLSSRLKFYIFYSRKEIYCAENNIVRFFQSFQKTKIEIQSRRESNDIQHIY